MKIWKIKINRIWFVIILMIALFVGYSIIKNFFKNPLDGYVIENIGKGEVLKEISETGSVRATNEAALSFKSVGKVSRINVSVGDNVKKGDILAELDSSQVLAQLQSARAALYSADTQYEKLLNGSTEETIQTYKNAIISAENNLQSAYDSALNTLNGVYIKIYNAFGVASSVHSSYFSKTDQQGTIVLESRNDVNDNMESIKIVLDRAINNKSYEDIDQAISQAVISLDNVKNDLQNIRNQCDQGEYYIKVASADKSSLDTQISYINTESATATSVQQGIKSYKILLQEANDNLIVATANPRSEDVNIYQSQIDQAKANVYLYQSQLDDNYIRSPIDGKITAVNAKKGETVSYSESIINLLSIEPFQIKVDVYEQDIVDVDPGDTVKINLVAFPKEIFEGKVLSIDPAEKIVDNVVYYQVTIDFPNQPSGIRSGMTADIVIEANKKDNVLRISKSAVESIDGKSVVEVINNKKIEIREIEIGLEGSNYYEILSGLNEGDRIIISEK